MNYLQTLTEARDLLAPIPDENWTTGIFTDRVSKCCTYGHYNRLTRDNPNDFSLDNCHGNYNLLGAAFWNVTSMELMNINDNHNLKYRQPTPKARVIAALNDAIAIASKTATNQPITN